MMLVCVAIHCRITLTCGAFFLSLADDASLWLGSVNGSEQTVEAMTELFSFGSGDFAKDSEGTDIMSDVSENGRWAAFHVTDASELVCLEKQRKCPEHLAEAAFFNKDCALFQWFFFYLDVSLSFTGRSCL